MGAEGGAASATIAGMRVRAVRELGGRSRTEVARAAGLTRRELAAIERGNRALSHEEARAIGETLNVEADALLATDEFTNDIAVWVRAADVIHDQYSEGIVDEADRRVDHATRSRVEDSWLVAQRDMDDVLAACTRVSNAGSGDDLRALLKDLELSVDRLARKTSFQRQVTQHNATLAQARGTRQPADAAPATG